MTLRTSPARPQLWEELAWCLRFAGEPLLPQWVEKCAAGYYRTHDVEDTMQAVRRAAHHANRALDLLEQLTQ